MSTSWGFRGLLFLLFLTPAIASSQHKWAEIITTTEKIDSIQAFVVADSLFISYTEAAGSRSLNRFAWISADGDIRPVHFSGMPLLLIPSQDVLHYYFLERKGDRTFLKSFTQAGGTLTDHHERIPLNGELVGYYSDGDTLCILLFNQPVNMLNLMHIRGQHLIDTKSVVVPWRLANDFTRNSKVDFFEQGSWVNTFKGLARTKLYKYDNLIITTQVKHKSGSAILVFEVDFSNKAIKETGTFQVSFKKDEFNSFLFDQHLFAYAYKKKLFNIQAFDIHNKIPKGQLLLNSLQDSSAYYYIRIGRHNRIFKSPDVSDLFRGKWDANLVVFSDADNRVFLRCGQYYDDYDGGYMMGAANPYRALINMAITTAINQALDDKGQNRYLYFQYVNDEFSYRIEEPHLRQKLDDYEVSVQPPQGWRYKGYFAYDSGVLAVYQERKGARLSVIKFEENKINK